MFRDRFLQVGRDEGFDDYATRGVLLIQNSEIEQCLDPIIRHEGADLITRKQFHLSIAGADGYTHAVAIRISCDHQIGAGLFGQLNAETQGGGVFRVR
jgi:hypothetical protein